MYTDGAQIRGWVLQARAFIGILLLVSSEACPRRVASPLAELRGRVEQDGARSGA